MHPEYYFPALFNVIAGVEVRHELIELVEPELLYAHYFTSAHFGYIFACLEQYFVLLPDAVIIRKPDTGECFAVELIVPVIGESDFSHFFISAPVNVLTLTRLVGNLQHLERVLSAKDL